MIGVYFSPGGISSVISHSDNTMVCKHLFTKLESIQVRYEATYSGNCYMEKFQLGAFTISLLEKNLLNNQVYHLSCFFY